MASVLVDAGLVLVSSPQPHVRVLTLNRPSKRNALSQELIVALIEALSSASSDGDVHVIIITGSGSLFSAGADLKDIAKLNADGARQVRYLENLCHAVDNMRKPVIAAVEKMALGGGFELALMCDVVVSSTEAVFGFPEVNVGLLPGAGGTQRLTSVAGKYRAMKMILSGSPIPATEAEAIGVISSLCEPGRALDEALSLGGLIAGKSQSATQLAKEAVQRGKSKNSPRPFSEGVWLADGVCAGAGRHDMLHVAEILADRRLIAENLSVDLEFERSLYYSAFGTADKQEGVKAFIEKRTPVWQRGGGENGRDAGSAIPIREART